MSSPRSRYAIAMQALIGFALALGFGCQQMATIPQGSELTADPEVKAFQLMSASKLATYKAAIPKFGYQRLNEIVSDPTTIWYDKDDIVPSYQDTVSDTRCPPQQSRAGVDQHYPGRP